MGRGFVLCAVACTALALAVYAGLFEPLGVPASGAVFLLLALCLLFHGASIYLLKGDAPGKPVGEESSPAVLLGDEGKARRRKSVARP